MSTEETPQTSERPATADDASRVGWFLTAMTGFVVVIGLAVINYVTGSRPRPAPTPNLPVEPLVEVLPDGPPPIILRPAERAEIELADPRVTGPTYR